MFPGGASSSSNHTKNDSDSASSSASDSATPTFMKKSMSSPALNWILGTPPLSGSSRMGGGALLSPYRELEDDDETDSD